MSKRLAFLKLQSHPINNSIAQMLAKNFPELEIDVIDVGELVKRRKALVLRNMFFVFKEYGLEILIGRKNIKDCFWRTPFVFRAIKVLVSGVLSRERYEFSIQNQSMFDGSREGLPHYVYTDHTHLANLRYPGFNRRNLYSRKWIEMERSIYHNAVINFTRSNYASESIIEDYGCPQEKVICVYAGSNVRPDSELNRQKYENRNILFVGMDWKRKGGPELVEAFKRVLKAHPDARLTIVGCSPQLNIPNCTVVGRVPLESINHYYENASVFCLPTRLEPLGISFLEALTYGLPIVATDIASIPDLVHNGENGYLVKLDDFEHLSRVLIELLGNPEKCRIMGENGRRLVSEKFNWERVGAEIARNITATIDRIAP